MALLEEPDATEALHAQSLDEFRQHAAETLDRVNRTGEPEMLLVDGEVRGVVLSRDAYVAMVREAQLNADLQSMRKSLEQLSRGDDVDAEAYFDGLHQRLLAMRKGDEGATR